MKFRHIALILSAVSHPPLAGANSADCAVCHQKIHDSWSGARHGRMLQLASAGSVLGDFHQQRLTLRGLSYRLRAADGGFYITETSLTGVEREHRVVYTLGSRRIQHYLTKLADGRIVVLPPSWDVLRKEWFHNLDIGDPDAPANVAVQVWNKGCFSCHVSHEEKNYKPGANTYATTWRDFGTSCDRCHGEGSAHLARHREPQSAESATRDDIALPGLMDPARSTAVCAQCHSLRDMLSTAFEPGGQYLDFFMPILEYGQKMDRDPAYWADGRPRRFSNDAIGFWQSKCFLRGGATCLTCHTDVHTPDISRNSTLHQNQNGLCSGCHAALARNVTAHSHHAAGSPGSVCVECHMPRAVFSVKAEIRDHSISIPAPENSVRHGIPNACGTCHKDRDSERLAATVRTWYGPDSGWREIRRAGAFSAARHGDSIAIEPLLKILHDNAESPVLRANALGHVSQFTSDARARAALQEALRDSEPLLRAIAAIRVASPGDLLSALSDPVRSVRVGAALSLVNLRAPMPPGFAGALEAASREYEVRASIQADDGPEQFNLGAFELLRGKPELAAKAFASSLILDPRLPSRYYLACVWLALNQQDKAVKLLHSIPPEDASYGMARTLLGSLPQ